VALPEQLVALACIVVTPISSIKHKAQGVLKGVGHSTHQYTIQAALPGKGQEGRDVGQAAHQQLNLHSRATGAETAAAVSLVVTGFCLRTEVRQQQAAAVMGDE
jgi:hypothetical protein